VDLVIFNVSDTRYYTFISAVGKTVKVVNGYDQNNNIYIYSNGYPIQLSGGSVGEMVCVQGFISPAVSGLNYPNAGWLFLSMYDNNWG
jgi:hypothetical protein